MACAHPLPDKVSFLWFFLFFSRKKRKNGNRNRKQPPSEQRFGGARLRGEAQELRVLR